MEIVLNSNFSEISYNEMELIEGGGWREFGYAMGGTLLIAGITYCSTCTRRWLDSSRNNVRRWNCNDWKL